MIRMEDVVRYARGKGAGDTSGSGPDADTSPTPTPTHPAGHRIFTPEELAASAGDAQVLRLAILGSVFDVSAGRRHYGTGGDYAFFAGRDASRAFVTGEFDENGLREDIEDLTPSQILGIFDWLDFMEKHYTHEGIVVGAYYDSHGYGTRWLKFAYAMRVKGLEEKEAEKALEKVMPPCNSQWSSDHGGSVWCEDNSGGIRRGWAGVPRQLFDKSGAVRCACVNTPDLGNPSLRLYDDCAPDATRCKLPDRK